SSCSSLSFAAGSVLSLGSAHSTSSMSLASTTSSSGGTSSPHQLRAEPLIGRGHVVYRTNSLEFLDENGGGEEGELGARMRRASAAGIPGERRSPWTTPKKELMMLQAQEYNQEGFL